MQVSDEVTYNQFSSPFLQMCTGDSILHFQFPFLLIDFFFFFINVFLHLSFLAH